MSDGIDLQMEDWAHGVPLHAGPFSFGIWQPSPEVAPFWQGVARGELSLKHCVKCDMALHPKRIVCPKCGGSDLGWQHSVGRGHVYSFSEVHRAPSERFEASVPYTVGMVTLREGVTLFTRLFAEPGPIRIDAPAVVDFRVLEFGLRLPVFQVG